MLRKLFFQSRFAISLIYRASKNTRLQLQKKKEVSPCLYFTVVKEIKKVTWIEKLS